MFLNSLKKKNVVITGSNKGIGKATLEDFSKQGANIFACVRKINKEFKDFTLKLKKKYKIKIHIIELDLSKKESIRECVNNIFKKEKKIDILINNAGILFNSLFQMTSEKKLNEMFEVNFFSHIFFTQLISRNMLKYKKGNIIFVASTSGIRGDEGRFAYSATKSAIINTTKTISKELARYNVRVNSISPGLTKTDLMITNTKKEIIENEIKNISLKRVADPSEISSVILFLASENSSYINGQNIIVDGGYL